MELRPYAPGTPQRGEAPEPGRPGYAILRQDEDWSWLSDPARRNDPLDRLKSIKLDTAGEVTVTLGLESYVSYRNFRNELFGVFPGADATANTRFNPSVAISFGNRLRVYGELKHGYVFDRRTPALPINKKALDVHQAFAELSMGDVLGLREKDAFVRIGRQELHYGNGRLIATRAGPNVRADFDGGLLRVRVGSVVSDAFLVRPTTDRFGYFDNAPDPRQTLWGLYTSIDGGRHPNLDVYILGQHRAESPYGSLPQPVTETRHTLGARLWTAPAKTGWSAELEFAGQFGTARLMNGRSLDIQAYTVSGAVAFAPPNVPIDPTFGLEFGLTSGDRRSTSGTLETFRAPAPPGRYFGEANPFGPGNLVGFRPYVELRPNDKLKLKPKAVFFWRTSLDDGVYNPGQTLVRPADGRARYVGWEAGLEASYQLNRHLAVTAFLARFFVGDYLKESLPSKNIDYAEFTVGYRF